MEACYAFIGDPSSEMAFDHAPRSSWVVVGKIKVSILSVALAASSGVCQLVACCRAVAGIAYNLDAHKEEA